MTNYEHAEEVLKRVLAARPWIDGNDVQHAGNARYARAFKFAAQVTLQVLYTRAKGTMSESLEVAIVFDENDRSLNLRNLERVREELDEDEVRLGLVERDGEGGKCIYLGKFFELFPSPDAAYAQATELCLNILDLQPGGRSVRESYKLLRDQYARANG